MALQQMLADPERKVGDLCTVSQTERVQHLDLWNRTAEAFPADRCVHELFEDRVRRSPDAIAVMDEGVEVSYAELNSRANQLAGRLIARGVRAGDRVATILDRSHALITAQLAILKAGAAYVPIDLHTPAARQAWLINDCGARIVVANTPSPHSEIPTLSVPTATEGDVGNLTPRVSADATAYVMYTSGSTGQPKGVLVPHRAVNRLIINGYAEYFATDRVSWLGNPAFDMSTAEVWAPLLHGARLVVVPHTTVLQPAMLRMTLLNRGVNVLHLTPGLLAEVVNDLGDVLTHLRLLVVGEIESKPS